MSTKIDPKKFDKLLGDFTKALKLRMPALVVFDESDEDFCLRKSYRYAKNNTLGFFLINLYEDSVEVIVDSTKGRCKVYSWHDEETFTALRPLIHKTLEARLQELEAQVVYQDDDTLFIVRPSTPNEELCLFVQYKGKEYWAEAEDGKIKLNCYEMAPDVFAVYMHAIEKYLIPRMKGKRHA